MTEPTLVPESSHPLSNPTFYPAHVVAPYFLAVHVGRWSKGKVFTAPSLTPASGRDRILLS